MSNWLVAVGTQPPRPDATAEEVADVASPESEVALLAGRALVHGGVGLGRPWCVDVGWGGMAGPVTGLAAGVAVEPASTGGGEGGAVSAAMRSCP